MAQRRQRRMELNRSAVSARAAYLHVARVVSAATGVDYGDIIRRAGPGQCRRRPLRFARQAAIYLTVTACDVRQGQLARALKRPRVRIVMACRAAEDSRETPAIDDFFQRMEALL